MDPASSPNQARILAMARALRARRKRLRLTQIQLSQLSGCGPDFIYDLEAGKPTLRLDKLLDVVSVLGLELVLSPGKQVLRTAPELAVPEAPTASPSSSPSPAPSPKRKGSPRTRSGDR